MDLAAHDYPVTMSSLTPEQQRKIEENRQRALARRAERLAQGTCQQDTGPSNVNAYSKPNAAHFGPRPPPSGSSVPLSTTGPSISLYNRPIEKCQPSATTANKQVGNALKCPAQKLFRHALIIYNRAIILVV